MFEIAVGDSPGLGVVVTGRVLALGEAAASGDAVSTVPVVAGLSLVSVEGASLLSVASAELLVLAVLCSGELDAVAVADALVDAEDAGVSGLFLGD